MISRVAVLLAVYLALACVPSGASAAVTTYGFSRITNNGGPPAVESQLSMSVYDYTQANADFGLSLTMSQVLFLFQNAGPNPSSICDVYFDDGTLLGIASVVNYPAVSFSQGAKPGDLPGGTEINFDTTAGFLADSDSPTQHNGVNPGEQLGIVFNLIVSPPSIWQQTIDAMTLSLANPGVDVVGGLRVGIHVQGFAGGQSESYVNGLSRPPQLLSAVPEPASLALWGMGLVAAGFGARRMRKSN